MIVEADNKGKIMADEYRSAMRGQMELENENEGKVLDLQKRKVE